MRITYEQAIRRIAERTYDSTRMLRKTRLQRRTEFTDLYGIPFYAQGDSGNPATFYISISPDLVYYLRFQFKLEIRAFSTTVKGATESATVDINGRNLSVSGGDITPNPHDHTAEPHTHNVIDGMSFVETTADDFEIYIDGEQITDYLIEQHDDDWIDGEGIYPTDDLEDNRENFYDLLDVASMMYNMGEEEKADKILKPGFKKIEITSSAPFGAVLYLYCKHSSEWCG